MHRRSKHSVVETWITKCLCCFCLLCLLFTPRIVLGQPIRIIAPKTAMQDNAVHIQLAIDGKLRPPNLLTHIAVRRFPALAESARPKACYQTSLDTVSTDGQPVPLSIPGHVFRLPGRYLITAVSDGLAEAAHAEVRVQGLSLTVSAPESTEVGQTVTISAELRNTLTRTVAIDRFAVTLPEGVVALDRGEHSQRRIGPGQLI